MVWRKMEIKLCEENALRGVSASVLIGKECSHGEVPIVLDTETPMEKWPCAGDTSYPSGATHL